MPKDGTKVEREASASPEPPVLVDESPVLVVVFGRGANGKSTGAAEVVWRMESRGRPVIVADGDYHRSRTLSDLFPQIATYPASTEPNDVKAWLTATLNRMVRERASVVLDCGTENRVLQEYCRDLRLVEFCRKRGFGAAALYFLGPEAEDLRHVLSIWGGEYFRPERALLVLNEGVVRGGKSVAGAFDATLSDAELAKMLGSGVKPVFMRRLAAMDQVRQPGVGFYRAEEVLEPVEGFMVDEWVADLEAERTRVGADGWF